MSKNHLSEKYKKLTDIEHVLLRPGMYVGSIKFQKSEMYLLDEGRFKLYDVSYNPGFLKLFDEIISNSVDEHRRGSNLNKIEVTVTENSVSVRDNGGIPVEIHPEHDQYIPEMIFSNLKAGSNFNDDEQRTVAGTHGVGATLTNIYSKKFTVKTADKKNSYTQVFEDNMHVINKPNIRACTNHYTEIIYEPDLERFGMKTIDEITVDFMRKRVADIAACNPNLKLIFNGENYKYPVFREYCELYTPKVFFCRSENWNVGLGLSDNGFKHVSFVNSVETKEGGTHVDYIINQITTQLRELIKKKHKVDVKPSELRNHMFLFVECTIYNSSFSSQTKERLITESRDFGSSIEVPDKFIKFVFESEIIKSVLDWIERKKAAEEKRELRKLNKNLTKTKVLKLIDAKAKFNRHKCVLGIYEGQCLEENTLIKVFKQNSFKDIPIKDINIGDYVLTHNNKIQEVFQVSKKIEQLKRIKLKNGIELEASYKHRFFVFNSNKQEFNWVKVDDLDIKVHKFLKNRLIYFENFYDILNIKEINNDKFKYELELPINNFIQHTENSKLCIFDKFDNTFKMLDIKEVNINQHLFVEVRNL